MPRKNIKAVNRPVPYRAGKIVNQSTDGYKRFTAGAGFLAEHAGSPSPDFHLDGKESFPKGPRPSLRQRKTAVFAPQCIIRVETEQQFKMTPTAKSTLTQFSEYTD